jgi:uncharacterized protein (DUF1697 family)
VPGVPVGIAMLRGINVGGKNILPMAELRALCEGIGLRDVGTYIQSGNVVFRSGQRELAGAAAKLEKAIEAERGFRPRVAVRTHDDLSAAAQANPFATSESDAARVLVMFLVEKPLPGTAELLAAAIKGPERGIIRGREVYLHFPAGVGKSKLSMAVVEKAVGAAGTCRNLNTLGKLIQLAAALTAKA